MKKSLVNNYFLQLYKGAVSANNPEDVVFNSEEKERIFNYVDIGYNFIDYTNKLDYKYKKNVPFIKESNKILLKNFIDKVEINKKEDERIYLLDE